MSYSVKRHSTVSNPFNIQPLGNKLLHSTKDTRFSSGFFTLLPDELLFKILVEIGAFNTIRLSKTCRYLYVWGYHDDLWRHFCARRGSFDFKINWRNTFKFNHLQSDGISINFSSDCFSHLSFDSTDGMDGMDYRVLNGDGNVVCTLDRPLKINGFYSDYLYSYWRCTLADLSQLTNPSINTIDRRSNLTLEEFEKEYLIPNKPLILTDVVQNWECYHTWSFEYFLEKDTERSYQAEEVRLTFKQYYDYMLNCNEESPLYLFDKDIEDFQSYTIPQYFQSDLFKLLPNRPDYRWLIIGPTKSGSSFHLDPNSTSAWNAIIKGSKKWVMYPPNELPPGVFPSSDNSQVTTPASVTEWFMNHYHDPREIKNRVEATVERGQVLFVPHGWWHCVINLEPTIAITQNFVNKWNLKQVLKFARDKSEQVSGYCGDLYEDFKECLKEGGVEVGVVEDVENGKKRKWDCLVEDQTSFTFSF